MRMEWCKVNFILAQLSLQEWASYSKELDNISISWNDKLVPIKLIIWLNHATFKIFFFNNLK